MLYGKNFGQMNFDAALANCKAETADVSIPLPKSAEENKFIKDLLTNGQNAWLGITDQEWILLL